MEDRNENGVLDLRALPEGCIAKILSFTGPRDACRLSVVSSLFRSAADSDLVWIAFLPSDAIPASASSSSSTRFQSLKDVYFDLCDHPVLLDQAKMSFWLERGSGKKCYMLSARALSIVWGDTPRYWRWISGMDSRFPEVAELLSVCWLEIHGMIDASLLSASTKYAAFLVFKTSSIYGFENIPVDVSFGPVGDTTSIQSVYLSMEREQRPNEHRMMPRRGLLGPFRWLRTASNVTREGNNHGQRPKQRADGWLEVELGEFVTGEREVGELQMSLMEVRQGNWKGGLIVLGIEIRPKE